MTVALLVASGVEHVVGSFQMRAVTLDAAQEGFGRHAVLIGELVASEGEFERALALGHTELRRMVAVTPGVTHAALLSPSGENLVRVGPVDADPPSADRIAEVIADRQSTTLRQAPSTGPERYEFLVPVQTPHGVMVLEVEQEGYVTEALVEAMAVRQGVGLLVTLLVAVPLSYLLGGRVLHRRQRRAEEEAETDALTGLLTRRAFQPVLDGYLAAGSVSLALVDVDDFKRVNDTLGHSYGDRVLQSVAQATSGLRGSDQAFRLGGDEFAVVLPAADEATAVQVLDRFRAALTELVPGVTVSCGIAEAADGATDAAELWERADAALYEAKRLGRRRTVAFTSMAGGLGLAPDRSERLIELIRDPAPLRASFQPIWDLRHRRLVGYEGLLRLPGGAGPAEPAAAFVLAERLGVARDLDRVARRTVLATAMARGLTGTLFLNVHPETWRRLDVDVLAEEVAAAGLRVQDVVLEVTEQGDLDNAESVRRLRAAAARGFRLALDDLGAGNAGLRAMTLVDFHVLKLDRSVVSRLGRDVSAHAVVAAAAAYAGRTGGLLVVEGIEDEADLERVLVEMRGTGAELAGQGHLLGRPTPYPRGGPVPFALVGPHGPGGSVPEVLPPAQAARTLPR